MNLGKRIVCHSTVLGIDDKGLHIFHLKKGQEIEVKSFNKRFGTVRAVIQGKEVTVNCAALRTLSKEES